MRCGKSSAFYRPVSTIRDIPKKLAHIIKVVKLKLCCLPFLKIRGCTRSTFDAEHCRWPFAGFCVCTPLPPLPDLLTDTSPINRFIVRWPWCLAFSASDRRRSIPRDGVSNRPILYTRPFTLLIISSCSTLTLN